jgi:hypothetical protein
MAPLAIADDNIDQHLGRQAHREEAGRTMSVRRVVTGHDDMGKAVVVSDEDVQPTDPDFGPNRPPARS